VSNTRTMRELRQCFPGGKLLVWIILSSARRLFPSVRE